ncbi:hypothetical protein FRC12_000163 [Ceratobasidium sp. 428]|nr:hypothetical protein FRC12_000163 [Ceratobasidium sp. 428]
MTQRLSTRVEHPAAIAQFRGVLGHWSSRLDTKLPLQSSFCIRLSDDASTGCRPGRSEPKWLPETGEAQMICPCNTCIYLLLDSDSSSWLSEPSVLLPDSELFTRPPYFVHTCLISARPWLCLLLIPPTYARNRLLPVAPSRLDYTHLESSSLANGANGFTRNVPAPARARSPICASALDMRRPDGLVRFLFAAPIRTLTIPPAHSDALFRLCSSAHALDPRSMFTPSRPLNARLSHGALPMAAPSPPYLRPRLRPRHQPALYLARARPCRVAMANLSCVASLLHQPFPSGAVRPRPGSLRLAATYTQPQFNLLV